MDDEQRDYLFRFVGYGDPTSPLWFIGIEEGGEQGTPPEERAHHILQVGDKDFRFDPDLPEGNNPVWRTCRRLSAACGLEGRYFMSNMAPYSRPTENTPLDGVNERSYHEQVRLERIPNLAALIARFQPRAVVFHGKRAWSTYGVRETMGLPMAGDLPGAPRVHAYSGARVMLTNSFSRAGNVFSGADRELVVGYLSAWAQPGSASVCTQA